MPYVTVREATLVNWSQGSMVRDVDHHQADRGHGGEVQRRVRTTTRPWARSRTAPGAAPPRRPRPRRSERNRGARSRRRPASVRHQEDGGHQQDRLLATAPPGPVRPPTFTDAFCEFRFGPFHDIAGRRKAWSGTDAAGRAKPPSGDLPHVRRHVSGESVDPADPTSTTPHPAAPCRAVSMCGTPTAATMMSACRVRRRQVPVPLAQRHRGVSVRRSTAVPAAAYGDTPADHHHGRRRSSRERRSSSNGMPRRCAIGSGAGSLSTSRPRLVGCRLSASLLWSMRSRAAFRRGGGGSGAAL